MKFRKFLEFSSFSLLQLQWTFLINTPLLTVIQFLRSASSTGMDLLLVIVLFPIVVSNTLSRTVSYSDFQEALYVTQRWRFLRAWNIQLVGMLDYY